MGDRISISFKNGDEESVTLFSHWRGRDLLSSVQQYVKELKADTGVPAAYPISRGEPNTVMVDFIRWLTKDMPRVTNDLYLGRDESEGDNSDNGHYTYDLDADEIY